MKLPFKGSLYFEGSTLFDVVRIYSSVIKNGNQDTYLFFMFFPLILTFGYISLVLLIDSTLRARKNKEPQLYLVLKILQFASSLIFWVLLIPSVDFFISIYECDNVSGYHKIVTSMQCWTGNHAFYCALFSLGLVGFLGIAFTVSLLCNESCPTHTDALTRFD